ncbi:fatty acid synthase alpha subunit Lsd1, partial [Coemansia brasiliensis]
MADAQSLYVQFKHAGLEQVDDGDDNNKINQFLETLEFINYAWNKHAAVGVAAFKAFDNQFVVKQNIHTVLSDLDFSNEQMQEALQLYYRARHSCSVADEARARVSELPALFASADFRRLAVFAGQGGMDNYMDETRSVFAVYRPLVEDFVREMAEFIKQEAQAPLFASLYQYGLDVMHWIEYPEDTPEQSYMISVPVCLPIVGMTQLMQIMVLYKSLGISPAELADKFDLATGHSQGIVSAVVLSMATDEESFYRVSKKALGLWILTGTFPQLDYPLVDPPPLEADESAVPTPMVAVLKLTRTQLQTQIDRFNEGRNNDTKVHLSLINGPRMHVVSGVTSSLRQFIKLLTTNFDTTGSDQTRVPYSQRKPRVAVKYLSINGPYHSILLEHACAGACTYAEEHEWLLDGHQLRRPVKTYEDGRNIQGISNLSQYLLRCMMVFRVDWPAAVELPGLTHVVDFGPGGTSGIGSIVQRIYEGRGIAVVCAGAFVSYGSPMRAKADLYRFHVDDILPPKSWVEEFAPRLVRCIGGNSLHIDTPMSRLLGRPPVMVAGMTPSTVSAEFVSAVINAGYHIELSGGGHFSEPMLRDKVDKILKLVEAGSSITVNSIYVNPFLWNIQYPALQAMRREGIPMEGLCIGAGVPSFDVCNDIIAHIREIGFRHIGLKPGSVSTIRL